MIHIFLSDFPIYRIPFCLPPCIHYVRIAFLPLLSLIHISLCFPYYSIPFCSPPCIHHVRITFLPLPLPDTFSSLFSLCIDSSLFPILYPSRAYYFPPSSTSLIVHCTYSSQFSLCVTLLSAYELYTQYFTEGFLIF